MECKFGCFSSLVAFLLRVYPLWWFDSMDQVAVTRPERLVCVFACLALLWVWHRFPPIRVHPFGCGPHPHPFHRISLLEGMAGNVVMHWFGLGFFLSFFRSLSPLRRHPLDPPSRRDGGKTPSLAPPSMGWDGMGCSTMHTRVGRTHTPGSPPRRTRCGSLSKPNPTQRKERGRWPTSTFIR